MYRKVAKVFIVAGEASGDKISAKLAKAMRRINPNVNFVAVGGARMRDENIESLFPMADINHSGLSDVIANLPTLTLRFYQTLKAVVREKPDALITVDSKGFNLRLLKAVARQMRGESRPALIQFVAPSVWAFANAPERAAALAGGWLDHLLVLLPFEEQLFRKAGVPCTFVGHTALDSPPLAATLTQIQREQLAETLRRMHGLTTDTILVGLLPGSRTHEVRHILPVMLESAIIMRRYDPSLQFIVTAAPGLREMIEYELEKNAQSESCFIVVDSEESGRVFAACKLALAASGTINLELAAAGVPQVAVYRTSLVTQWWIQTWLRPVINYATLPNILAGRSLIPELLFDECRAAQLASASLNLLASPSACAAQVSDAREQVHRLGASLGGVPIPSSELAALCVWRLLEARGFGRKVECA